MKISYNVALPERGRRSGGKRSAEALAIMDFLKGTMRNMCIAYDSEAEAKRRFAAIQAFRRKNPQFGDLIDTYRNGSSVYVIRLAPKDVKAIRSIRENQT